MSLKKGVINSTAPEIIVPFLRPNYQPTGLTGEPFEISKALGSQVISGAINNETALTIRAIRMPVDSRCAKIMKVMEMTEPALAPD